MTAEEKKPVVISMDGSDHADYAFHCKWNTLYHISFAIYFRYIRVDWSVNTGSLYNNKTCTTNLLHSVYLFYLGAKILTFVYFAIIAIFPTDRYDGMIIVYTCVYDIFTYTYRLSMFASLSYIILSFITSCTASLRDLFNLMQIIATKNKTITEKIMKRKYLIC
jgi:hypothetical protein